MMMIIYLNIIEKFLKTKLWALFKVISSIKISLIGFKTSNRNKSTCQSNLQGEQFVILN